MQKRMTARDGLVLAGLTIIFGTLILAMYMVDRQWLKLAEVEQTLREQAGDLRSVRTQMRELNRRLGSGAVALTGSTGADPAAVPPAFERAYAASQAEDYAQGDWLVDAFGAGLKTITPLVSTDAYAGVVQQYVIETLLTRDPDSLEWQGLLARDWQVSDDGLEFTFDLRSDISFSDGEPFTAEDVVFSFAFIMNPEIAAPRQRAYYEKIASVTSPAPGRVIFRFKEPYFNSLALAGGMEILAKHFYQPYLQNPEAFNQSRGLLLGTGPYRLKDPKTWTPDKGLVELERNPRYWGPVAPSFDRVLWKVIENDSARLTTFRNGEIDAYAARPQEYHKLLADKELNARSLNFEYMNPVAGYSYLAWNQDKQGQPTIFADRRVRLAMTLLTDRRRIIEEIFLDYAEPAISPFNPRSQQHDPALEPHSYDLERALALLREVGYEDRDGDKVLEDRDGKPFRFELTYFQDNEDSKRMVLLLKDLYARAGVLLVPKPSEWPVMLDLLDKRTFDAITLGWTSGIETDIYQMFHSSQRLQGGDNFIGYANPELDRLIDQARATVDEDARMALWRRTEDIMHADQPYTFLVRRQSLLFLDRRLRNLQVTKLGLNFNLLPLEIYAPGNLQRYVR